MRVLEKFFYAYGTFLARHPWPFITVPLLLTLISTYGFTFFHSQDDIWDIYAPLDGLSRIEEKAMQPFEYASASHHYRIQILASRKDGKNMLEEEILSELNDAHSLVSDNVTLVVPINGTNRTLHYRDVCGVYCKDSNAGVIALLQTFVGSRRHSSLKLTFPNANALQQKFYIGYSLGEISFDNESPPNVLEARLVDTSIAGGKDMAVQFEKKIEDIFNSLTVSSGPLRYQLLSRDKELLEQRAITLTSIPFLGLTVLVLAVFMLITLTNFPLYTSQHIESIFGILSPGMALWTSTGFLWWAGYPFSNILTIVPFLTVTIGIDDAFLILAGWRHSTKGASLEQRMGESIAISGASVTVTSVTDVLCFAIGLFSNMPVVRLFSLYTTVALAVDFFYQLSFFTAVMALIAQRQISYEESKKDAEADESFEKWKAKLKESTSSIFSLLSRGNDSDDEEKESRMFESFIRWLHTPSAKIFVMTTFALHIGLSSWIATKVNTAFDMENLYLKDSPLTEISRRMQNHLLHEAFTVNFAMYPMPDFSNSTIRDKFEEMVTRLETIPEFTLPNSQQDSTNLWTREYAKATSFWGDDESFWDQSELLKNFREYEQDEKFITIGKDEEGNEIIDGFFFTITYRNFSTFLDVERMMEDRRGILAEYKNDFTVFSHHPFEKVPTESAASAPRNFLQTAISAIILMSLLVLLFVMDAEAIVSVVASIISICLGTVSYLHVWGVHLDAVSLISCLMSIGFSVDYSAHVCYHYFAHARQELKGKEKTTNKFENERDQESKLRLLYTLRGVGWPVIQSGLSTLLGMIPLIFVRAYVVAVFWKTVILVTVLGMTHALLLLPIIFILTNDFKGAIQSRRREDPSTNVHSLTVTG